MRAGGILHVCKLVNTAAKTLKPVYELQSLNIFYYDNKNLGMTRAHFARQDGIIIDKIVRCYNCSNSDFSEGEYVVLDDGEQMQITDVNEIVDLDCVDLSLKKVNNFYAVAN